MVTTSTGIVLVTYKRLQEYYSLGKLLDFEECDYDEVFCFLTSYANDCQFLVTVATRDCSIQVCGFTSQ